MQKLKKPEYLAKVAAAVEGLRYAAHVFSEDAAKAAEKQGLELNGDKNSNPITKAIEVALSEKHNVVAVMAAVEAGWEHVLDHWPRSS